VVLYGFVCCCLVIVTERKKKFTWCLLHSHLAQFKQLYKMQSLFWSE